MTLHKVKPEERQAALSLLKSEGWVIVSNWIFDKMSRNAQDLLHCKPTEAVEIARLQATHDAYKTLLRHIEALSGQDNVIGDNKED